MLVAKIIICVLITKLCFIAIDCGNPEILTNGTAIFTNTTLGSSVVYMCDSLFILCGNDTQTCLPNGMWSGSIPRCNSKCTLFN